MATVAELFRQIQDDPQNQSFTKQGIQPLFHVDPQAEILIISQAPSRKAQASMVFWDDPSGDRLRDWMGLNKTEFYHSGKIAVMPTYKRHSSAYPYYGLFFSLCQHYLQRVGYRYITDGSRTITEHSQIHDFLIQNFHFRRAYCQLEVHYCWWMKIAVKMLYPFRKIISLPRIKAILNMEAMQRGEK